MKKYLIVHSYVKRNYNADNDRDTILSCIPEFDNYIIEANSKKEAIEKFHNYHDREYYTILNIIELEI